LTGSGSGRGDGQSAPPFERRDFPLRLRTSLPSTRPALNRAVRAVMRLARVSGCVNDDRADLEIACARRWPTR